MLLLQLISIYFIGIESKKTTFDFKYQIFWSIDLQNYHEIKKTLRKNFHFNSRNTANVVNSGNEHAGELPRASLKRRPFVLIECVVPSQSGYRSNKSLIRS